MSECPEQQATLDEAVYLLRSVRNLLVAWTLFFVLGAVVWVILFVVQLS